MAGLAVALAFASGARADDGSWLDFFSLRAAPPADLVTALESYAEGRYFEALTATHRLRAQGDLEAFGDDVQLLRGLVLARLGWNDPAVAALADVLEQDPPSPYHPLALLHLLEAHRLTGRRQALVDAYRRHFAAPWDGSDRRSLAIRNYFFAYGDLREGREDLLEEERERLFSPEVLGDRRRRPKERPSDRLVYLAGVELLGLGEHEESLAALQRIGIASPYFRYAAHAIAQNQFALGEVAAATRALRRLISIPVAREAEGALRERARLLLARILVETGALEEALRLAEEPGGIDSYEVEAALLRGEILADLDEPALAAVVYRDLDLLPAPSEARRALGLGEALRRLGDSGGAASALRRAAEQLDRTRGALEPNELDARIDELAAWLARRARYEHAGDDADRRREAEGIARVLEFEGPWNLGRLARVVFVSHENTLLGEKVYDVRRLAVASPRVAWVPPRRDPLWLALLASERRFAIEAAARRAVEIEGRGDEASLLALDAVLRAAEGAYPLEGEIEVRVGSLLRLAPAGFPVTEGTPADAARFRRHVLSAGSIEASPAPGEELLELAGETLREAVRDGLRSLAREESEELRELELDVALALSDALGASREELRRH